jgi:tRNA-splicing endonuclease subunit Sen34
MASAVPERQVRISRIGGRYLVFDIEDVVYIRRHHGMCAVFVGTMPQNPTQSILLSLPIELYAEEAKLLVDKKAAYIADDATDHLSQLKTMDSSARKAYFQSLKSQRKAAQRVFDDNKAKDRARHAHKVPKNKGVPSSADAEADDSLFGSGPSASASVVAETVRLPAVTPTTSNVLMPSSAMSDTAPIQVPPTYPLYAFLNARGYYITPGLRFGGDYSVYPGDPFHLLWMESEDSHA